MLPDIVRLDRRMIVLRTDQGRLLSRYTTSFPVIGNLVHKGLQDFFGHGNKAGSQAHHASKLARQLRQLLDAAVCPQDLNMPGWSLYKLHDSLRDNRL
jgi:hypothetical protein